MRTASLRFTSAAILAGLGASGCTDSAPTSLTLNGPPAAVALFSGNSQIGTGGTTVPQPLVIEVTDAGGTPVPAQPVQWSATAGTISAPLDSTGNDGKSSVSWTLPIEPGVYEATATVAGFPAVKFTAQATPGAGLLVFRYIDAGSDHSCGIATDEQLYCWGYNGDGQLGIPAGEAKAYPNLVPSVQRFRSVSGGRYHTCGVTLSGGIICWGQNRDGRAIPGDPVSFQAVQAGLLHTCGLSMSREVWCWGSNGEGQLGSGTAGPSGAETRVSAGTQYKAVAAGGLHTCGIKEDGTAWCWGSNAEGQLGTGDPIFRYIDAGSYHSCGIATDEQLYCWGYNGDGQLGIPAGEAKAYPILVPNLQRFRSVSGGRYHTCGVTLSGGIICWGQNRDSRAIPGDPVSFQAVQAGLLHTCGLNMSRQIWCWGSNGEGQVGPHWTLIPGITTNGSTPAGSLTIALEGFTANKWLPSGTVLTQATFFGGIFGKNRAVVRDVQADTSGQVTVEIDAPTTTAMPDSTTVIVNLPGATPGEVVAAPFFVDSMYKTVTAGGLHTCGIKEDGTAWCWGFNAEGQLGTGGLLRVAPAPTRVASQVGFRTDPMVVPPSPDPDFPLPPGPFIAAGHSHTCALGVDSRTYCWGLNENGQLGDGTTSSRPTPVPVSGGIVLSRITAGQSHSCGLASDGKAYCWGDNSFGQLGDGTTSDRLTPTAVGGSLTFAYLKAGDLSTCGVTTTGVGYCWGDNEYGQIGNGLRTAVSVPTKVVSPRFDPLPTLVASPVGFRTDPMIVPPSPDPDFPLPPGPFIAAGHSHTCALGRDDKTYCWGLNENGQLGDGTTAPHRTPVPVSGSLVMSRITAGQSHSCGLTSGGQAYCWGDNTFGQLGDGTTLDRLTPTLVGGGLTFSYLKAGDLSTCGVTTTGVGYCWGDNEYGQIGNGGHTAALLPAKIAFQR